MISVALVGNDEGSNVGIVASDTGTGKIVYKFIPSAQFCADLIDTWTKRSIISEDTENAKEGERVIIRTRVIPNEERYLEALLSKVIQPPYRVKYIEKMRQNNLGNVVESEFNELI